MKDLADIICALSTPPGRSGIAVVRISGPSSTDLLDKVFLPKKKQSQVKFRQAILGRIRNPLTGFEIDEAIAICFSSPNSYTGEDMIEFSLHGSPVLISEFIHCLLALGIRLAEPGEFTMRAFLHGRMDLSRAEAVRDIIDAATLYQAQVASRQHSGALARQLKSVKEAVIDVIVNLESAVEFVEEDLEVTSREMLTQRLDAARQQIMIWIDSYRQGRIIREGFNMAIVGRPNVGKSSIFNALLAQNRSIVTETPGTTRDLVSEYMNIGGIPVRLQDTAGIQHSENYIEKLGIDWSYQAMADADAILLVIDTSVPLADQDSELRQRLANLSCMVVMNKCDLVSRWSAEERSKFADSWIYVDVSAKTKSGIEELRSAILNKLLGTDGIRQDTILITNLRHVHALESAENSFEQAAIALNEGLSEEFALMHLHSGLKMLGVITGETHTEDLLEDIFSRFCVGK